MGLAERKTPSPRRGSGGIGTVRNADAQVQIPCVMGYHALVKALVKAHAEPGLWLQDIPEPEIGINDVLIRVLRTGICGTDLHIYDWNDWARETIPTPLTVGHEFVGEIVEV